MFVVHLGEKQQNFWRLNFVLIAPAFSIAPIHARFIYFTTHKNNFYFHFQTQFQ